jgi:hypothetical protein
MLYFVIFQKTNRNFPIISQVKYVGRKEFEPGDTKCQLIIQPNGNTTTQRSLYQYRSVACRAFLARVLQQEIGNASIS